MFIEEIIIDGFKSYATRTVVSGFDPRFNAITGLNGSGKSNVLDAICFVLGITNLSQVRANNLQELVYKQGQAGVTKASVTIIFNNQDPHGSPVGYEQYEQISVARQVVIGGRNKYLINGHTAQVSQVQNLFHSVQLNVNNPHFLIMQGHITKVLNMKPPQILGMIEEAAGTRMYENKKQAALKTMMKKEKKVEEINQVLAQEITPTLEKLRQEKTHYLQWASNNTEMERLQRFCIAFEYTKAKENMNKNQLEKQKLEKIQEDLVTKEKMLSNDMDLLEDQMENLQEQKELEMGENFQLLKQKEETIEKEMIKYQTKKDHLTTMLQKLTTIQKQNDQVKKELHVKLTHKKEKLQKYTQDFETFQKNHFFPKEKEIKQLQLQIQNLHSGMVESCLNEEEEEEATSFAEQLALKQRLLQEEKTLFNQTKMKLKHMEKNVFTKRQNIEQNQQENSHGLLFEKEQKCLELKQIQENLKNLEKKFSQQEENQLKIQKNILQDDIIQKERELEDFVTSRMSSKLTNEFEFTNPETNFDRSKVKGLLAKLFETKKEFAALALEITAGGKLYQIVVDNEKTAKMILQYGRLMQRVTMIPLNKITRRTLDPLKKKLAQQIAQQKNAKVWEAIELIHFDPIVRPAMEYTFGNTLICENSELAKSITFHKDLKIRTVTLEGDSFDPAGTLQGGSAPNQNNTPILLQLHRFLQATKKISSLKRDFNQVMDHLNGMQLDSRQYDSFLKQKEMKEYELKLLEDRIASSEFAQMENDLNEMEAALQNEQNQLTKHEQQMETLQKEVMHLQKEIQLISSSRHEQLQKMEAKLHFSKKQFQEISNKQHQFLMQKNEIEMDLTILQKDLENIIQNDEKNLQEKTKVQKEHTDIGMFLQAKQIVFNELKEKLQAKTHLLQKCDEEIKNLQQKQNWITKQKNTIENDRKKNEHKIQKITKELQEIIHLVSNLFSKNTWIENEKEFFGKDHTDYDFTRRDPLTAKKRMMELQEIQAKLSKKINKKVMGMIEKAEQEYQGLMHKREIIEKDKEKITSVIKELDTKKNEALQTTWLKVNKDFGSIFSTLLPGTTAKLEPPANSGTILDGLQVRVAFGNVWKESLTELSGGQRSLLALSLILSLLLFKPAPMYILDEVDAALDLSHTQNIGQMIRSHFAHSQFIVVSLKEGMFNNANVVFRTKFVDGVSTVTRTVPTGAASAASKGGRKQK